MWCPRQSFHESLQDQPKPLETSNAKKGLFLIQQVTSNSSCILNSLSKIWHPQFHQPPLFVVQHGKQQGLRPKDSITLGFSVNAFRWKDTSPGNPAANQKYFKPTHPNQPIQNLKDPTPNCRSKTWFLLCIAYQETDFRWSRWACSPSQKLRFFLIEDASFSANE